MLHLAAKNRLYFFIVFLCVFLLATCGCTIKSKKYDDVNSHKIEISGAFEENGLNNYLAGGELGRINNDLYFSCGALSDFGIIKLSKNGSEMIHKYDINLINDIADRLYVYNDGIYRLGDCEEKIEKLNISTGSFSTIFELKNSYSSIYSPQFVTDSIYYLENINGTDDLLNTQNGTIVLYDVAEYWVDIDRHTIWFSRFCDNSGSVTLYIYDCNTNRENFLAKFDNYVRILSGDENRLYFYIFNYSDYSFEVFSITNFGELTSLYRSEHNIKYYSVNTTDDYVYIGCDTGVYRVDTLGNKTTLCSDKAKGVYIVDDKWVYFTTPNNSLKRILNSGGNVELVYSP